MSWSAVCSSFIYGVVKVKKGLETHSEFMCCKSESEKLTITANHCSYEQLTELQPSLPLPSCEDSQEKGIQMLVRINYSLA